MRRIVATYCPWKSFTATALAVFLILSALVGTSWGEWSPIRPATSPTQTSSPETSSTGASTDRTTISIYPSRSPLVSPSRAEIDMQLREGRRLETERRWGEALTHYEEAMRRNPNDIDLRQRYDSARLHYDVMRRYNDRSYCNTLIRFERDSALRLYARVLLEIQLHYVKAPDWKELVDRGRRDFEVALSEPVFCERHVPRVPPARIEQFQDALRRMLAEQVITSRESAQKAVVAAAEMARQRLQINPTATILEFLCGATNALDPYSAFLTPDQLAEIQSQIDGNFVGLGIELKAEGGQLLIVRVIPNSPAEESGLLPNDRIVSVDGKATADFSTDEAANMLQGEANSVAALIVVTPGKGPRRLTVRRRRVEVPSIDGVKILDSKLGVGYLRLLSFQKTTSRDLDRALWKLHGEGMKSLIMDLRGNPGGLLITGVEAVDRFVERGIIVTTRGRSIQEDFTYMARARGTWRVPLVVLIDHDSASAAEIFAGAIRDHGRGTIVGARSYGKGTVQGIFELDLPEGGVRLTTAKFFSPTGRPYSRVGVQPDVVVHSAARPIDGQVHLDGSDTMLAAALQTARQLPKPR